MKVKVAPPSFETYKPLVGAPPRQPAAARTRCPLVPGITATSVIMLATFRLKLPLLGGPPGCSTAVQLVLEPVLKLYKPCEVAARIVEPFCTRRKIRAPLSSSPPTRAQVPPPSLEASTPIPA